jgi:uncharacterized protein
MTTVPAPDPQQPDPAQEAMNATLDVLEEALASIAERHPDDTPDWELCEGFMTALLCMRRAVTEDEWLPVLFGGDADALFASPSGHTRFLMAWLERQAQLLAGLDLPDDEQAEAPPFDPAITDWRGLLATLPEAERAEAMQDGPPPALARSWAAGFMAAVLVWPDDWTPPRDKELARDMGDALETIDRLTEDDTDPPAANLYEPSAPPSVSATRQQMFDKAMEAVFTLYDIAQILGPRVPTVRNLDKTGRNDPCPCGSGKKYKKCCGA